MSWTDVTKIVLGVSNTCQRSGNRGRNYFDRAYFLFFTTVHQKSTISSLIN